MSKGVIMTGVIVILAKPLSGMFVPLETVED